MLATDICGAWYQDTYNNQSTEVLKAGLFWCVFMHIV